MRQFLSRFAAMVGVDEHIAPLLDQTGLDGSGALDWTGYAWQGVEVVVVVAVLCRFTCRIGAYRVLNSQY